MAKGSNHNSECVEKVHGITFSLFILINVFMEFFVYPHLEQLKDGILTKTITVTIIDIGLYAILYLIVKVIYNLIISKTGVGRFCNESFTKGKWFHVHIPYIADHPDYSRDMIRAGITEIDRDLCDLTFKGTNYNYSVDNNGNVIGEDEANQCVADKTEWYTVISEFSTNTNDYDVIQIYSSSTENRPFVAIQKCPCCGDTFETPIRIEEADKNRYGIHKFTIKQKNGVEYIECNYSDCWPSLKSGKLYLYKTKKERDDKIKAFFETKKKLGI